MSLRWTRAAYVNEMRIGYSLFQDGLVTIVARHSREMEEFGSEGGVQVGGREGSVTSVAIV